MTFTPDQIKALEAPLDPRHVVKPTGQFGAKGDYIEGWHAIAEANRIFGFDGWSYTIAMTQDSLREGVDSRQNPQWQAAYTCICTVTVGDVTRQDVGFGSGFAKQIGDAIEGATKEAATDALKRALRSFGNAFGLALYDKSRANVHAPEPELPAQVEQIITDIETMTEQADLRALWEREKDNIMGKPWQGKVVDIFNAAIAKTKRKAA